MVDPIEKLHDAVEEFGSVAAFSRRCGLSPQYVHDVISKRRNPSDRLLTALGLEKIVVVAGDTK